MLLINLYNIVVSGGGVVFLCRPGVGTSHTES